MAPIRQEKNLQLFLRKYQVVTVNVRKKESRILPSNTKLCGLKKEK